MKPKNSYLRDARQGVGIGARLSNQQAQGHSHLLRRLDFFLLFFFGNWCASLVKHWKARNGYTGHDNVRKPCLNQPQALSCRAGMLWDEVHWAFKWPWASPPPQEHRKKDIRSSTKADVGSSPQSDHCGKGKRSFWSYKGQRDAKSQEVPEGSRQATQGDEDLSTAFCIPSLCSHASPTRSRHITLSPRKKLS